MAARACRVAARADGAVARPRQRGRVRLAVGAEPESGAERRAGALRADAWRARRRVRRAWPSAAPAATPFPPQSRLLAAAARRTLPVTEWRGRLAGGQCGWRRRRARGPWRCAATAPWAVQAATQPQEAATAPPAPGGPAWASPRRGARAQSESHRGCGHRRRSPSSRRGAASRRRRRRLHHAAQRAPAARPAPPAAGPPSCPAPCPAPGLDGRGHPH